MIAMVKGNIPSTVDYEIDELGRIYGYKGRILRGRAVKGAITRTINYTCKDTGTRKNISMNKLIYSSFYPDNILTDDDIVIMKDPNIAFPFNITNLEVIKRVEGIKKYIKESKSFFEDFSDKHIKSLIKHFKKETSQVKLAKIYNVSTSAISRAKKKLL